MCICNYNIVNKWTLTENEEVFHFIGIVYVKMEFAVLVMGPYLERKSIFNFRYCDFDIIGYMLKYSCSSLQGLFRNE